ncbi:MAG: sigma 54-interacting transcriptional regulator [Acidobacteriota bacterium]
MSRVEDCAAILIVEDEAIVQAHLRRILERLGHRVVGATGRGEEALEIAARESPDLVLMDIRLAGDLDGIETALELRRTIGCSVVFLTAFADTETLERAGDAEAAGYLIKPFEVDEVRAAVATALAKERAVHRVEEHGRDLVAILDQLDVGTAMLDDAGLLSFVSRPAARLLDLDAGTVVGRPWRRALPFDRAVLDALDERLTLPQHDRERLEARPTGSARRLELDVRDDPRSAAKRILFVYDISERHTLQRLLQEGTRFHDLVGSSPPMLQVYEQIRQVAAVDWPAVIEGETGSGKELVARAIHAESPRAGGPFVAVNCAGLTESLLASQLFGHRRGAFTGAVSDHRGFFETASGGTLFLDEIGDVPLTVQTSFLRVLEDQRVTPLGATAARTVDVRIVTASHRDLGAEVAAGRFRADLLYRIRVARVRCPPLRERGDDLRLLAHFFLDRARAAIGKPEASLGSEALRRLAAYNWPGNVRELRGAIEHALICCRGVEIQPGDLPPEIAGAAAAGTQEASAPADSESDERRRILGAIERAGGNRSRAARLLGISRATLYRRLEQLEID